VSIVTKRKLIILIYCIIRSQETGGANLPSTEKRVVTRAAEQKLLQLISDKREVRFVSVRLFCFDFKCAGDGGRNVAHA
jgi:hypothetical protein